MTVLGMSDMTNEQIVCATYTHARRHPTVLGQIAGWTPPVALSVPQLVVIVGGYWLEIVTWDWWARFVPGRASVLVAAVLPLLVAWVVRRTRIEGRSLPRAVLGWGTLLLAPRRGQVGGRAHRRPRPADLSRGCVFVTAGDDRP